MAHKEISMICQIDRNFKYFISKLLVECASLGFM